MTLGSGTLQDSSVSIPGVVSSLAEIGFPKPSSGLESSTEVYLGATGLGNRESHVLLASFL